MTDPTTTRKGVLKRALALAAGAAGAGAVAGAASASSRPQISMLLTAREVLMRGTEGQRHAVLLGRGGETVGQLAGTQLPLASPLGSAGAPSAIELHTLTLPGGTLLAQGAVDAHGGTFHVVGGTGRFALASGSYHYRLDGGRAALELTVATEEGR